MESINALTQELCDKFESAGFKKFKMRKFEEYSLYLENKSFLTSEYVITFNDLSGKLLALKPDVTLSIVKNTKATDKLNEKLYYTESVYRLDAGTHEYKEIDQIGLEMLGNIDSASTAEIILLALDSLEAIGRDYVLDISHMGILNEILDEAVGGNISIRRELTECIESKNTHDLMRICEQNGIDHAALYEVVTLTGDFEHCITKLGRLCRDKSAVDELYKLYGVLKSLGREGRVNLDFSIVTDSDYYTGVVFKGFVDGVHRHVLSGGRYDKLSGKFRKGVGAMGFAVYLNDLAIFVPMREYDCDVLLIYKDTDDAAKVIKKAQEIRSSGLSVRIAKNPQQNIRYKELRQC